MRPFCELFKGGSDGADPHAGLTTDSAGNLYGTTYIGGDTACQHKGCGTIFKIIEGQSRYLGSCATTIRLGSGRGNRTHDIQLGKLSFYH